MSALINAGMAKLPHGVRVPPRPSLAGLMEFKAAREGLKMMLINPIDSVPDASGSAILPHPLLFCSDRLPETAV